jgi:hypothetical protein
VAPLAARPRPEGVRPALAEVRLAKVEVPLVRTAAAGVQPPSEVLRARPAAARAPRGLAAARALGVRR